MDFNTLEDAPAEGGGRPARHGGAVSATTAERLLGAVSVMFQTFGLGNLLYGLFFLFPELERGITWAANAAPTATFKRVRAAPVAAQPASPAAQHAGQGRRAAACRPC